ncbi:MAG: XRE family transcriptional regulator [Clostridia bacterium]|nr:XRE family transcriptional regulator [Clostridia bacterium]
MRKGGEPVFYLKQYDTTLLSFEIIEDPLEGQSCHIVSINEDDSNLLPVGLKKTDEGLMSWLRGRIIPKNREYVNALLAKSGLAHNDTKGILQVCRGLSLNDSYWVVEDGFNGAFSDFNLYDHDFVKVLSLIAYTGYGTSRARGFSSSPEFTTAGMLRKGWRRLNGRILLFKGGTSGAANTGNEPYSEFYAAQIAEQMGIQHVTYGLSMWKRCLCSTCELFCDIDHSYVPIYCFVDRCTLKTVAEYLKSLGSEFYDRFIDMLIFDALIYNEDRHFGNFGLMVDNKTNRPYAFAPLFDHGLSLFNYAMPDDLQNLEEYAKTRLSAYNVPFENIVKEFISGKQKERLRRMIDFRFQRHSRYNLPAERLKAIEKHLQKRTQALLSIPSND